METEDAALMNPGCPRFNLRIEMLVMETPIELLLTELIQVSISELRCL